MPNLEILQVNRGDDSELDELLLCCSISEIFPLLTSYLLLVINITFSSINQGDSHNAQPHKRPAEAMQSAEGGDSLSETGELLLACLEMKLLKC